MASIIPEVLNHFNIYNGANALVGVSGEVELPELEAMPAVLALQERFNSTSHAESPPIVF